LKAGFPTDIISRLPDAMDTVSDVANANVSQAERENFLAHSIKIGVCLYGADIPMEQSGIAFYICNTLHIHHILHNFIKMTFS
jgi:hypothetical protein